jgi:hypothetical protein
VREQREVLQATLQEVLNAMDAEEARHRAGHRDKKLTDAFPSILGYHFEKVHEAIRRPDYFEMGGPFLGYIADCVSQFKAMLVERGEWDDHGFTALGFEGLQYPLEELKKYFVAPADSKLNDKDAIIFIAFIRQGVEGLERLAEEIDAQYQKNPTGTEEG